MKLDISGNTLFIIPCCAKKVSGGQTLDNFDDILSKSVCSTTYNTITSARAELLNTLRKNSKYVSNKYSKNKDIKDGPDFGLNGLSGKYLPAIDRYDGKLYSAVPNFSRVIKANLSTPNKPKILILSALYGPLHPLSMIQDYNLKMPDSPAYQKWKEYYPSFLKEYVQKNKINSIHLYLGSSTAYFKVAKEAILPLLKKELINRAIQFEVEKGNSYHTPYNHGLLVSTHLQSVSNSKFTRNIIANVL